MATRTFSDLDFSFNANPVNGDVFKRYDETAIKNSIKSLILTNHGERPFHPEIGSPIRNLLFENYSPMVVLTIKRAIEYLIENYEPRVVVLDVSVDPYMDENEIVVGVLFRIKNTNVQSVVSVTLERTR